MGVTSWTGHPRVRGPTEPIRLFLLTCSLIGLQFAWGFEMTYCTPYLLSLGLSKSKLSLVWVAGPLSGLVMQPIIGTISDGWNGRWGRRRPFMVAGAGGVAVCLLLLGWMGDVVGWFVKEDETRRVWTIAMAVLDIYVLDFVINVVQSCCRSLIVDTLPVQKQQLGSAWASRVVGCGHLLIYGIGSLDLNNIFGPHFLGDTQFKKVCVLSTLALLSTVGITCWAVEERVLVSNGKEEHESKSAISIVKGIWKATMQLPPTIQAICWVQFWSWIGWFPFLFYGSTWVGEIYLRYDAPSKPDSSGDALSDVGRVGSTSLIVFSIVSFAASLILPYLAKGPDDNRPSFTPRPPRSLAPMLEGIKFSRPSLPTAWMMANALFAASMVFAPLVQSVGFATLLVALCGLPWAVGNWASFALIGTEINRLSSSPSLLPQTTRSSSGGSSRLQPPYSRLSTDSLVELQDSRQPSPHILHLRHDSDARDRTVDLDGSTGELAGIYLGILNLYTTLPQFVGTGISTVVFTILEPGKSPELAQHAPPEEHHSAEGVSGIGVCLFIGAVCAVVAAWKSRVLAKMV